MSRATEVVEVAAEPIDDLEVRLVDGVTLTGRIRGLAFDDLGALTLVAESAYTRIRGQVTFDGVYRIEHLAPGRWRVNARLVQGGRLAAKTVIVTEDDREVLVDLDFGLGATLHGEVSTASRPAAGVSVSLSPDGGGAWREVSTANDGTFEIGDLDDGVYRLTVVSPSGFRLVRKLEITSDEHVNVELGAGSVRGRVVDILDGSRVVGAYVRFLSTDDESSSGQAHTDSSGAFLIEQVPEGRWRIVVDRDGYASSEEVVDVRGDLEELVVKLQRTGIP